MPTQGQKNRAKKALFRRLIVTTKSFQFSFPYKYWLKSLSTPALHKNIVLLTFQIAKVQIFKIKCHFVIPMHH